MIVDIEWFPYCSGNSIEIGIQRYQFNRLIYFLDGNEILIAIVLPWSNCTSDYAPNNQIAMNKKKLEGVPFSSCFLGFKEAFGFVHLKKSFKKSFSKGEN